MYVKRGTFVVEDSQLGDLTSNSRDLSEAVAALDTQENDEALARSAGTLPRRDGLADGCIDVTGVPTPRDET